MKKLRNMQCARINDVTGVIMLCRGPEVSLWTLNGDPILEQNICVEGDKTISSCAFYEGSGEEYLERNLIFTGHKKGVVNVSPLLFSISGNLCWTNHSPDLEHGHLRRCLCSRTREAHASFGPCGLQHWHNYHIYTADGAKGVHRR